MRSQEQNTECKMYYSWMRGHHAYKDVFQPEINQVLAFQREPENTKDRYAVAVTGENERIVGYIPLGLSKIASFLKRDDHHGVAVVCGKRVNRGAGLGLEIPVIFKFYGKTNYLERLDILIQSSETARMALRLESEGITSEETAKSRPGKRKSISNHQTNKMPRN